jgi:integrase
LFRRARYQKGALQRVGRKRGPDVWVFRWYETQVDGLRVRRKAVLGTVEQYPSESAAQAAADALRININQESPRRRTEPISVETLWRHYAENELPKKEFSTQLAYKNYVANWIMPRWKSYRLQDVRTIAVEQWLHQLPMTGGSKGKIKCILSAIFSHAVRWELADRNPIAGQGSSNGRRGVSTGVRVSTKREKIPVVLSVEQIRRLLELLPRRERTMVLLAATTGLRISELVGLQWRDVDHQNMLIHVRHAWVLGRLKDCKTEASQKPIPLDPIVADALAKWQAHCAYNSPDHFVFASALKKGKAPLTAGILFRRHVLPAAYGAGIENRIGWHTFRHTVGTLLSENGENVKTVQELLRHASPSLTLTTYCQGMTETKRTAHGKVVKLIVPGRSGRWPLRFPKSRARTLMGPNGPSPQTTTAAKPLKILVSAAGFEPATHALKGHCSTN